MSKKIIGPALPPHLQHLLKSQHSEEASLSDSSKSPGSPTPKTSTGIDDDEDDGVLVLHVSDDELLVDGIERPATQVQPPNAVSSCKSNPSKVENMFGPSIPLGSKADSRCEKNLSSESDDEDSFAPELPPNFIMNSQSHSNSYPSPDGNLFGPAVLLNLKTGSGSSSRVHHSFSFGPALPPNFKTGSGSSSRVHQSSDEDASFGPALPPNFKTGSGRSSDEDESFGPALPPNFRADSSRGKVIGPTLPLGLTPGDVVCESFEQNSESDEDVVGPLPPTQDSGASSSYIQQQLDARALRMMRKLAGEDEDSSQVQARETWMLELPPDRSGEFGLGPRQFRARAKLDLGDRSVWTDTPTDKQRRATGADQSEATSTSELKSETDMIAMAERDRAMQKLTDKHNKKKKRKESLVDLHQKKLKKKQKKEEEDGKPKERRPFDRNLDLQANRFDEAQKKAILRKAQLLDDRFSRGESKFL